MYLWPFVSFGKYYSCPFGSFSSSVGWFPNICAPVGTEIDSGALCTPLWLSPLAALFSLFFTLRTLTTWVSPECPLYLLNLKRPPYSSGSTSLHSIWKLCLDGKLRELYGLAHLIPLSKRPLSCDPAFPLSYIWKPLFNSYCSDFFASLSQKTKSHPWCSSLPGRSLILFVFYFI